MSASLFAFTETADGARRLADELAVPCHSVATHRFPDGESLVRVAPDAARTAVLYRSLDHPDAKIVELLLAASALRDNGVRRIALVAPYLAYMRQDIAFHPGEAVSQRVIGALLARHFECVLTIDPHLHRIQSLEEVMPGADAVSLTAAGLISQAIDAADAPVLVGPDAESRQWVEAIARPLGLDTLIGRKQRGGDRQVAIAFPENARIRGRRAILVDDVISSGETLAMAARLLREAGARGIEAMATHCLARDEDLLRLEAAGIERIVSTDSVPGPTARLCVAPLLAPALRQFLAKAG